MRKIKALNSPCYYNPTTVLRQTKNMQTHSFVHCKIKTTGWAQAENMEQDFTRGKIFLTSAKKYKQIILVSVFGGCGLELQWVRER